MAAGAQFIQTQYCYDVPMLRQFMQHVEDLGLLDKVFILVGVGPFKSAKAAEWISAHVPGVHIPPGVIARLKGAGDQALEGRRLCTDLIQEIRGIRGVHGVHLMAYRQEETVAEIIDRSGVLAGRVPWHPQRVAPTNQRQESLMTDTVISSATREVVLGFNRPFVMIGERINPTGRKILAAEMKAGDFSRVEADVLRQLAAGAHMLDVNAGIPLADEPAILAKTIQLVQSITDVPLSIDSSIVAALEAGLAVYKGKALVNSVTGEEERLETVLPLVKKYGAAVVAISNDETGISEDPDVRFEVARKIVHRAADYGIPVLRHRGRSAGHADRGHQPGRRAGVPPARAPEERAEGEHHLRGLERKLRPARARGHQRDFPHHGDRRRHDLRDHEPAARGDREGLHGGGRHDGS